MNDNLKDIVTSLMVDASDADIEKLSTAIVKKCAELEDGWTDSGEFPTFGARLKDHFGVQD